MVIRKVIRIDEELCNGCGLCVPNCAEGALQMVDGKAMLLSDIYCDGLGACLGHCPKGAISLIEREARAFDKEVVHAHLARQHTLEEVCSSTTVQKLEVEAPLLPTRGSALSHWPVQLNLVPVEAPFFRGVELLVVADCVPVAYPDLHSSLLPRRSVVIGCPKFDDARGYMKKLGEILKQNEVKTVIIVHMEVPCCSGLSRVVFEAVEASGKQISVERRVITVRGEIR